MVTSVPPTVRPSTIPLSFSQESTLLAERSARPGSINLGFRLPLGPRAVDDDLLRELWTNVCTRQEALTTRLIVRRSGMKQRFLDPSVVAATALDDGGGRASGPPPPFPEWKTRPFRHSTAPLFRSRITRERDEWVLDVALDHLISDEWSLRVLRDEVERELAARCGTAAAPAGSLTAIIERQRLRFAEPGYRQEYIDYWTAQHALLQGFRLADPLTTGPAVSAQRHTIAKFDVTGRALEALRRARRSHNASDFMLLLAAVGAALRPTTDSDHLSVWTIVNTRWEPDDFAVVGCLITPVLLSLPLPRRARARDVVPQARDALFAAMEYAAGPLEHRVPPFDMSETAPSPPRIVVQWIPPQAGAHRPAPPLTQIHWSTRESVEDITITFSRTGDALRCEFGCRDDWMTPDAVRAFVYRLSEVLASL